jgi:hypothetical protein
VLGPVVEPQSGRRETVDVTGLQQPDLPVRDEVGATDVDVVAPAFAQVHHVEPGSVRAGRRLETHGVEPVQQVLVQLGGSLGEPLIGLLEHRVRDRRRDQVDIVDRRALGVDRVDQRPARDEAHDARGAVLDDRDLLGAVAVQVLRDVVAAVPGADHQGLLARVLEAGGEPARVHDGAGEVVETS